MKTNILGWIYLIASPVFIFFFLILAVLPVFSGGGYVSGPLQPLTGILSLFFGVFGLIWGSAVRRHKTWSWRVGMVMIPLVAAGNMFTFAVNLEWPLLFPLLVNIFSFYALVSDKELFYPAC